MYLGLPSLPSILRRAQQYSKATLKFETCMKFEWSEHHASPLLCLLRQGLAPIFPSGCEGKLGVALESLQGLRDLT